MTIYFGETLKRLRHERELTQETLADFLGVSFQAVSKWERGETYPDITILPSVASFFGVTVDALLGIDKSRREEKIQEYIDGYYRTWQSGDLKAVLNLMKTATAEFPGEFSLLVRYLNALISLEGGDTALSILAEARSVYENIDQYCTNDAIRIWAKKLICTLYKRLSVVENSGVTLEDMEKILEEMPLMQNSRDFTATYLHPPGEKRDEACKTAVCELLYLLNCVVVNAFYYHDQYTPEEKITAAKAVLAAEDAFFPDGDYGKCWRHVIYNHGHLADWYAALGETQTALAHLRKCAELAAAFDRLPQLCTHTSPLLKGHEVDFGKALSKSDTTTLRDHMKYLFLKSEKGKYRFSEEFKNSVAFQEILESLSE